MATYTLTVPDAGDAMMRAAAQKDLGWDGVSDFGAFIQTLLLDYSARVSYNSRASAACATAEANEKTNVENAFGVTSIGDMPVVIN